MPGVLITTSQRVRASSPSPPVACTGRPSTPPSGGRSSTSTGSTPSASSLRMEARPSTPSPHTPTVRPRRSDQEIAGRVGIGDAVVAHGVAERLDGVGGRQPVAELLDEGGEDGRSGPVGTGGGERDGGPALVDLADALPRLERTRRVDERLEPREQRRVGQRLGPGEHRGQAGRLEERRQDQVDEHALVAPPAPVVEATGGVDVEAAVTALEG